MVSSYLLGGSSLVLSLEFLICSLVFLMAKRWISGDLALLSDALPKKTFLGDSLCKEEGDVRHRDL